MGDSGMAAIEALVPLLRTELALDLIVANGENAASGFGMVEEDYRRIRSAGVDVVTSGNHIWEKRDFMPVLDSEDRLLRPANYPAQAPGHGVVSFEQVGQRWTIINLQGREFMTALDSPFSVADAILQEHGTCGPNHFVLVDFHAESSQEKEALAFYLDGRVSALVGTHTHVATTDGRVLPAGSGYQTDIGMSGVQDGVIGMETGICIERMKTQVMHRMTCLEGPGTLNGALFCLDSENGQCTEYMRIKRAAAHAS